MISRDKLPQLTSAELDVMKVLWQAGKLSAREAHERLAGRQGWAYSTTRTMLERMAAKGLLRKRAFHGLHLYAPRVSRVEALARRVRDFAREVLETRHVPVVSLFAESEALTADELRELEALLADEEEP